MRTRRDIFLAAAAATALPVLPVLNAQQHQHAAETPPAARKPYTPKFFTRAEYALVSQVAERIIPRTTTPGAIDAGVPESIDRASALNRELGARLKKGVAQLRSEGFSEASEEKRIGMLKGIADSPFFKTVKDLAIDAYYTSRQGLTQELGWNANTFLSEFKGCTHSEHQS